MSDNSNTETVRVEMVDVSGKPNIEEKPAPIVDNVDMYVF